jgi:PASTA domain/Glucodextranase, domain B
LSRRVSAAALVALVALGGCGTSAKKPAPPVRLSVDAPADMMLLHDSSVEVHGTVSPGVASVRIEGRRVAGTNGRFSTHVSLLPGTNLIDVEAGAPRARPAMVAVRVRRQVTVAVPDLVGFTPSDAKDALAALGLNPDIQKAGGVIEFLLPEDARVCGTDPPAGTHVNPGSTVTVFAAKLC